MSLTFTNDEDITLIEPGKYEVVIDSLEKRPGKADPSKVNLNICFRIRDDVEQSFKNRLIWETLAQDKNATSNEWWPDTKRLSKLIRAAVEPTETVGGKPQWSFPDADSCIQALALKKISIYIDQEFNDFTGKDRNVIKYLSYDEPCEKHQVSVSFVTGEKLPGANDPDFPF